MRCGYRAEFTWKAREQQMSTAVMSHENVTNQAQILRSRLRSSLLTEETSQVQQDERDQHRPEHSFSKFCGIVGQNRALKGALRNAEMVAPTDSTVLILGETGTGKELIARAIHELGHRRTRTFVKVNCAAIPSGLLESELFGHEKGAFTGAFNRKIGRFDLAHEGTLFLDEVGDLPLELQPKLLRVLQEQEFERLGSIQTIRVNARLVAATSRDLSQMVEDGKFRSDLYYRLNVFPVFMPPLRERPDDIPQLVRHFVDIFSRRIGKRIDQIPQTTMDSFAAYHWPGNVRELQNLVERAVIRSDNGVLPNPLSTSQTNRLDVALTELSIAVRKGQPKPDIRSLAAVKEALLEAKTIAYFGAAFGGADGVLAERDFARLGIANEVAAKAKLWRSVEEVIAEKNADLLVGWQPPLLSKAADYEFVGPLPRELQDPEHSTWTAGVATRSVDIDRAKDFTRVLASPESLRVYKAKGYAAP